MGRDTAARTPAPGGVAGARTRAWCARFGAMEQAPAQVEFRLQDELATLLTGAAEIGAGIMAFIGRFQATKALSWRSA